MMPRLLLVPILIAILTALAVSQTARADGFISGRVTARSTGQPLMARISIPGRGETNSDASGVFRLQVAPGIYSVQISSNGFTPIIVNQVGITGGRETVVDARLEITLMADVEVRSEIFAENSEQTVSNVTLRREDLRSMPGTGGDPLRAINSQPAVTAVSGEFADLVVRGGNADENLTYVDNIPIRDFTYFTDQYDGPRGGRASILAPDVFERAEFSAGGFGSRYGDKLSSVLDVTIREANRRKVQGVLFADSGTAGGSLDVPITKRGSWLFSARRSYFDVALDVAGIADHGIIGYPRTLDFTNKFVFDLTARNKLTFSALNFFESFAQTDDQSLNIGRRTDRFRTRRTSQRHVLGATLSSTLNSKTLAQTTVWTNVNHNDGSFVIPFSTYLQRSRDLRDSQTGIKEDLSIAVSAKMRFAVGGGVYFDRVNYHTFENTATFYSPLEEEFLAPRRDNRLRLSSVGSGYLYGQAVFNLSKRFSVTPGIRIDRYGLTDETLASPRFATRFNAAGRISMTFAAGLYRQPPSLFQLSLRPENQLLRSQKVTHIIAGIDWLVREDIRVRFEAYRKSYSDLVGEQIGATPAFVSDGRLFNSGKGAAKGFEISVQRSLTGFLTGQASYGFIRSTRSQRPNGVVFSSDLERPHQLTLIGITRFYEFNIASKLRVASGLPYTRRTAVTNPAGFGGFVQRIKLESDINALRLPNFTSLDLRGEKRFSLRRFSVSPYIDIFNLTNHNTVVQPDYEFFRRTPQFLSENKRLPIFGFRLEF